MKLRIATRKSALALAQTTMAADAIVAANKNSNATTVSASASAITSATDVASTAEPLTYELVSMTTEGDRRLDKSLASFGGKGVFIKELEIALLENRADIAIHSLKDMPAEVLPEFKLAAVLKREDPRDAFLSRGGADGVRFMDLPAGARVGTGSIRRIVQLKALRPDIEYVPIRGNIQTRIGKLAELDGVVLAAAGLKRMGLADQVTEYFSTEQMLPASGQGILAVETLADKITESHQSEQNFNDTYGSASSSTVAMLQGDNGKINSDVILEERNDDRIHENGLLAQILARVNDLETFCVASAEMAYLKALNAGCQFPVASFAEFVDDSLDVCNCGDSSNRGGIGEPVVRDSSNHNSSMSGVVKTLKIRGIYWDEKSSRLLRAECVGSVDLNSADAVQQSKNLGIELAQEIKKQL